MRTVSQRNLDGLLDLSNFKGAKSCSLAWKNPMHGAETILVLAQVFNEAEPDARINFVFEHAGAEYRKENGREVRETQKL